MVKTKGLENDKNINKFRIGQSYELLFGNKIYCQEMENIERRRRWDLPKKKQRLMEFFSLEQGTNYIDLNELVVASPEEVLGKKYLKSTVRCRFRLELDPSQRKFLSVTYWPGVKHERWVPKSESWYYF